MTRTRRLVLLPLLAVAAGVLVALVVGGLTLLLVGRMDTDRATMADLGVAVLGLVVAVGLGVAVWLGVLVRVAVRLFARGRRLAPVVWSAGSVFGLVIAWGALAGVVDDGAASGPGEALLWLAMLVVLAAPSVVFVVWDRRGGRAR